MEGAPELDVLVRAVVHCPLTIVLNHSAVRCGGSDLLRLRVQPKPLRELLRARMDARPRVHEEHRVHSSRHRGDHVLLRLTDHHHVRRSRLLLHGVRVLHLLIARYLNSRLPTFCCSVSDDAAVEAPAFHLALSSSYRTTLSFALSSSALRHSRAISGIVLPTPALPADSSCSGSRSSSLLPAVHLLVAHNAAVVALPGEAAASSSFASSFTAASSLAAAPLRQRRVHLHRHWSSSVLSRHNQPCRVVDASARCVLRQGIPELAVVLGQLQRREAQELAHRHRCPPLHHGAPHGVGQRHTRRRLVVQDTTLPRVELVQEGSSRAPLRTEESREHRAVA